MRTKPSQSSFNLPVLLSFNELAWIAIFATTIACLYAWKRYDKVNTELNRIQLTLNALTNAPANSNVMVLQAEVSELRKITNALGQLMIAGQQQILHYSNLWQESQNETVRVITALQQLEGSNVFLLSAIQNQRNENLRLADQLKQNAISNSLLVEKMKDLQQHLANQSEGEIRRELLGLNGGLPDKQLSNVVILLDRSGSMGDALKFRAKTNRWQDALKVVDTWLTELPVAHCVLITFNDRCETVWTNDWIEVSGPNGAANRRQLVAALQHLAPEGMTDTLRALEKAYSFDGRNGIKLDTIILFTDGRPEKARPNTPAYLRRDSTNDNAYGTEQMMKEIHRLCTSRSHSVPINTVGIGDYFNGDLSGFLLELSHETGGTFIGR